MSNVFDSNLEQIHLTLCVYLRQGGVIVFVALICVTFSGLKYKQNVKCIWLKFGTNTFDFLLTI
jgi:hypothetical protein